MGRRKAGVLRELVKERGWLDKEAVLPANEIIAEMIQVRGGQRVQTSLVESYAKQMLEWAA